MLPLETVHGSFLLLSELQELHRYAGCPAVKSVGNEDSRFTQFEAAVAYIAWC